MRPYHDPAVTIEERWQRFWEVFAKDGWEPETKALVEEVLEPGDLFVDIGAWIGPVSLWAKACGAQVIAIEPDPVALPELKRQLPDAEIWEGAVAPGAGVIHLAPAYSFGDSMTRVSKHGVEVPCWSLPEILGDRKPKLVVMDIEGYELVLLPTVAPYLASLGATLMVALHTEVPDRRWFKGYRHVQMPKTARKGGSTGRSLSMVARP